MLTKFDGAALGEQLADWADDYFETTTRELQKEIAALQARIKEIPSGEKGDAGDKGEPGEKGEKGEDGDRGEDGAPGIDGRDGIDGKDADTDALLENLRNGIDAAIMALPVPKDGADGIDGKDGAAGADGKDGESIDRDDVVRQLRSEMIATLDALPRPKDGERGIDGRDGREGKDGEPGRDAAALDPLPSIDFTRSYPRGTWARHEGGLWLARAATSELEGWDCMVAGVVGIEVTQTNERTFTVSTMMSDGRSKSVEFQIPVVIWRGIFKDGTDYDVADSVTYAGSTWYCKRGTSAKPSVSHEDWQLMVKQGRDGKDAKAAQAEEKPPFPQAKIK